jgi:hypothetical protein
MIISDSLNESNVTTLDYSHVRVAKLPAAEFNADLLVR